MLLSRVYAELPRQTQLGDVNRLRRVQVAQVYGDLEGLQGERDVRGLEPGKGRGGRRSNIGSIRNEG